jgi:hypothetical protein
MPEFNLIQAPELLQRVRRALGLKQAHALSTLNEGVQAVVVIDDYARRAVPSDVLREMFGTSGRMSTDAGLVNVLHAGIGLTPSVGTVGGGRRVIRVKSTQIYCNNPARAGTLVGWGVHSPWPPTGFGFTGGTRQFSHPTLQEAIQSVQPAGLTMGFDNGQPPGAITHGVGGTAFWHPPYIELHHPELLLVSEKDSVSQTTGFLVIVNDAAAPGTTEWTVTWQFAVGPAEHI